MTGEGYSIRTAEIGIVYVISASQASVIQIGDRATAEANLRGVAVQREEAHTRAGNVYFESYPIFDRPLPVLIDPEGEAQEVVPVERTSRSGLICVGCVSVTAMSSSAILQAGNGMAFTAESRISNIRQFAAPSQRPPIGC